MMLFQDGVDPFMFTLKLIQVVADCSLPLILFLIYLNERKPK